MTRAPSGGASFGDVAVEVGLVGGVGQVAAHQQVVAGAGGGDPRPRVETLSLGPWPGRGAGPGLGAHQLQRLVGAGRALGVQGDGERARHTQDVPDATVLAERAQGLVAAVHLVPGQPWRQDAGGVQVGEDVHRELRFGLELHAVGHPGAVAACGVGGPLLRQVQPGADLSVTTGAGVGAVHDVDGVGDLPGAADVLSLDPGGVFALLLLPGLVQHRHRGVRVAQVFDDEVPHHAHRRVRVPHRPVEQALHPVRGGVPGRLGQRPAVLAGQLTHQPLHVLARLQAGLAAAEHRCHPAHQLIPPLPRQLGGLYHQRGGRLVFFLIHNLAGSRDGRPQTRTSPPTRRPGVTHPPPQPQDPDAVTDQPDQDQVTKCGCRTGPPLRCRSRRGCRVAGRASLPRPWWAARLRRTSREAPEPRR